MVGGGRPLLPEISGQPVPIGAKSTILNSQTDRIARCISLDKSGGRQYFAVVIGLSSTTDIKSACKAIEFGEKTQNKGYYAVQCHSRSSRFVPIGCPYSTSY